MNSNFYGYGFSDDNMYIPKETTEEQIQNALDTITVNENNELVVDGQEVATIEDKYVTGVAFDNENNTLTVTLNDGSTQSTVIELAEVADANTYVESASFDNENNTLTLTRNDGETITVDIEFTVPADTNTYVESLSFDSENNTLTLTRNDGESVSGTIDIAIPADTNTYVESASFDSESNVLTLTRNDGETVTSAIDITIPADTNTYVESASFDNETNILTLTRNDGETVTSTIDVVIPADTNTYVSSMAFDNENNVLTLTRNDGETVTANINFRIPADTNTYVDSASFDEGVLTLTRNDGTDITANIQIKVPSAIGDLEGGRELLARVETIEEVVRVIKLENDYLINLHSTSASTIHTMSVEQAANENVTITSDAAIEALSEPKTFNSVNIIGGTLGNNTVIRMNANESATMVATNITGTRGSGNGRVLYATPKMTIDGVTVAEGSTMYNVFEGSQDKQEAHLVNEFEAKNVTVDNPSLSHNVFNIYQVADNATIKVSNSYFNLDVANSNVMRLSNITNAENVNVVFENVDWTYENRDTTNASNNAWAGLVIIQPYGTDIAHNGDTSKYQTWNMTFRNCRYNGELVDANNFGTIKQVAYFYDLNKSGGTSDVVGTLNVTFE